MDDPERLGELLASGRRRSLTASVLVLPRSDGQYSGYATETIGLLDEAGVAAEYATDPLVAGVRSPDFILPALLVVFKDAASLSEAIEGVIYVIRDFTRGTRQPTVTVDVFVKRDADGSSAQGIEISGASAVEAERLLRQAARITPPD